MKYGFAKATFLVLIALFAASTASTGEGVPAAVHYVPHDQVAAGMAVIKGKQVITDPGFLVIANRREAGPVEYHEHVNHVFIMVDGEATFIAGGKMVGAKDLNPNEKTADSIEGGQTYHLTKGDIITIPAKTPHQWKDISTKTVGYYAINIESK